MTYRQLWVIVPMVLLLYLSGCSVLQGDGDDFFYDPSQSIPTVDGFDFPVGNRDGQGWGITGYGFLDWSSSSNSWHPGEDWNIPGAGNGDQGEPVYAIAHGKVIFSGWNSALGNVILLQHKTLDGNFVWSQYAHLDRLDVSKGELVQRRQQIGTVGRGPNNRYSAHLHFEIRKHNLTANAWPRTNGVPWDKGKVLKYWLNPSEFIKQNRPQ